MEEEKNLFPGMGRETEEEGSGLFGPRTSRELLARERIIAGGPGLGPLHPWLGSTVPSVLLRGRKGLLPGTEWL